jgi:hypothetical protein
VSSDALMLHKCVATAALPVDCKLLRSTGMHATDEHASDITCAVRVLDV